MQAKKYRLIQADENRAKDLMQNYRDHGHVNGTSYDTDKLFKYAMKLEDENSVLWDLVSEDKWDETVQLINEKTDVQTDDMVKLHPPIETTKNVVTLPVTPMRTTPTTTKVRLEVEEKPRVPTCSEPVPADKVETPREVKLASDTLQPVVAVQPKTEMQLVLEKLEAMDQRLSKLEEPKRETYVFDESVPTEDMKTYKDLAKEGVLPKSKSATEKVDKTPPPIKRKTMVASTNPKTSGWLDSAEMFKYLGGNPKESNSTVRLRSSAKHGKLVELKYKTFRMLTADRFKDFGFEVKWDKKGSGEGWLKYIY